MRVGVIGLGWPGQTHARHAAQVEGVTVAAMTDLDGDKARAMAEPYGASSYTDYHNMLDRERLDAVFLCTPHFVRLEPIREIAKHGIALFCEKPPAFTMEEALQCREAIESAAIVSSVGFMYRWARITEHVRDAIAGRTVIACLIRGAWPVAFWEGIPPWLLFEEKSGGPIIEQGVHLIDVARYLLQDDIAEVQAFQSPVVLQRGATANVYDTVSVNLRWSRGALGSHLHNWSHRGWVWEVDVICDTARLTWDMANKRVTGLVDGTPVECVAHDDCYRTEVEGFLDAVRRGDPSGVRSTYADSVRTLATALAARESLATGAPVPVPAA
ncbi:MAG TPA: Gfo/Idh/MocA family oxidoreductase [Chthonomonadales bacterium]|nr:Gfo/Idh/MocA family oxidoreductase [Chthonomonadales bacterium]